MREDQPLFAWMMVVCQRHPDIDIKETMGMYEFALEPRSILAPDGSMVHCSSKSALIAILEKLPPRPPDQRGSDSTTTNTVEPQFKVIIIDGMAKLQCLDKLDWVKNCAQLPEHFVATIEEKYSVSVVTKKPQEERGEEFMMLPTARSQI